MFEDRFESPVDGAGAVAQYPSISVPAVLTLLLGVASAGALIGPLWWCVPFAGAALAVWALRSIAGSERVLLGRRAAVIGLVLSLLFVAWGMTRFYSRQHVLRDQARQHAEQWLQLVQQGRLHEAHQLHLAQEERQAPDVDLVKYYRDTREPRRDFRSFFDLPPLREIVDQGTQGQLRFEGDKEILTEAATGTKKDSITLRYTLDYQQDQRPKSLPFLITLTRTRNHGEADARWEVRSVSPPPKRAA
jgi:hypothetical protein